MKTTVIYVAVLLAACMPGVASSQGESSDNEAIARVFDSEGIVGTLVIASSDGRIVYAHNGERSRQRFSPASTFKIPNTLIALDAGIVTSKDHVIAWDGQERGVDAWNRDQTLESAYRVSCVWCYQEIAREVGSERYIDALRRLDYGNQEIGDEVDQFWLNGDLAISAVEQIKFLKTILDGTVPYRTDNVKTLREIMVDEKAADYTIYAKTGWTGADLGVGWYVGFVEKGDQLWIFAMNMEMVRVDQAPLRKILTVKSMQALGLL